MAFQILREVEMGQAHCCLAHKFLNQKHGRTSFISRYHLIKNRSVYGTIPLLYISGAFLTLWTAEGSIPVDPAIIDLATKVMTVLLPFVSKGAEEFASKVGDAAYEKTAALLSMLKKRWSGDPVATADLTRFEEEPDEVYQAVLKKTLQKKLTEDKNLAAELTQLLREMGPMLKVIQKMEVGKDVIGVKATHVKQGDVTVEQAITDAEGVTGIEADTIG